MPRLNGTCQDFRKEGLVSHVGARIYQDNLSLIALRQPSFQTHGCVEPCIPAAYNNDSLHVSRTLDAGDE
jgi:hypothetical protein